jgi:acyl-CoA reductase-like NAD-dependent aldehyde dehydrogenase
LHSDQDFQPLKLPFEARLAALHAAKTLELGIGAKIHGREHHEVILKDLWSRLRESLQGKLALRGGGAAKAVERLLLKRGELRFRDRLTALLASGPIYHGGRHDRADKFIAPTVQANVSPDSPLMQEEIFGPILQVLEVDSVEHVIDFINARPSLLSLYVFAEDQQVTEQILDSTTAGDAAVNDCTIQLLIPDLPFGGVGNSGMGKYHGEWGFRTYTNARGVQYYGTRLDPDLCYPRCSNQKGLRELVVS